MDENSETTIVDNSTHLVLEWKYIYEYFNPTKENIDALWTDIRPAFDYLMEQTPRITVGVDVEADTSDEGEIIKKEAYIRLY